MNTSRQRATIWPVTTSDKPLLRVLAGETVFPPPIWLMRQAGRYLPEYRAVRAKARDFLDLCYSPERAAEVTLQPIRRYGFDAAILFSDILVVPHALGQGVRFVEGEGPKLDPVQDGSTAARLSLDRLLARRSPLEAVYEAVAAVRRALPPETALIGFAGAPWTVACYMVEGGMSRDFHAVKRWALGDPEGFVPLIDLVVDATIEHLSRQIAAGAEAVQLFDSHAGVLPDGAFERWAIDPAVRIVEALRRQHPGVPIIGFPRGAGTRYAAFVAEARVSAVSVDSALPAAWAARHLQPRAAVQGNLDPVYLLAGGDVLRRAAGEVLEALGKGPLIFNLGHGVIKETPPEHVADLVSRVRGSAAR